MERIKQLLERLKRGERLDSPVLEKLRLDGYIRVADTTNQQTPPGQREFLFIDFTDKGRSVLES
jgi:hypothetical protein